MFDICCGNIVSYTKIQIWQTSASTIARRIEDLAENLEHSLKKMALNFAFYSIAVDESTDMTDTAQLAIFIRGVDENFTIHEEFAALYAMKETTRGEDIVLSLKEVLQMFGLNFNNLAGILLMEQLQWLGKMKG